MPKLIKAMESVVIRGDGKNKRAVFQYYDLEDRFLAEFDPCPNDSVQETRAAAPRDLKAKLCRN